MTSQKRSVDHSAWIEDGVSDLKVVVLANEDDPFFTQRFNSRDELHTLVTHLCDKAEEAWPHKKGNDEEQLPLFVTVRDAICTRHDDQDQESDGEELHLECRFPDGQKYAAVVVDSEHVLLAHLIAKFLNTPDLVKQVKSLI